MIARGQQFEERLEALLVRVENQPGPLSFANTRELASLYRVCSAQLSAQRTRGRDPDAIRYLNALCLRAFTRLQVPPLAEQRVRGFFMADLPKVLAATAWLQAVVATLMLIGFLAGLAIVRENPAAAYECIPFYSPGRLESLIESREAREAFLERKPVEFGMKSIFSAALFTHNMSVGILSFAAGVLAGIPTLWLVFYNGVGLGAFVWVFSRDSLWLVFWAWLLPHAVPELLAVTLCSTGGLIIGKAVVAPGRQTVTAALRAAATPALELVTAAVPLFILAALMESFLRQSMVSTAFRLLAAAMALSAIGAYARYVFRLARQPARPNLEWLVRSAPLHESQGIGSAPVP